MNLNFEMFIRDARALAHRHGVSWDVELGSDGVAPRGKGWNLTQMIHAAPPPTDWLNDFGTDQRTVDVLTAIPPSGPVRRYDKRPLPVHWQDLIKACAIDQLLIRRNSCSHVVCSIARPLRVLATCSVTEKPWMITVDDVAFAIDTARKVQSS